MTEWTNTIAKIGLLLCFLGVSPAFAIFGIENLYKQVNEGNRQTQVELQAIKNLTLNTSAKVDATATAMAQIEAKLNANASAIAGVGNKVQQSNSEINEKTGRDKIITNTNDTRIFEELMEAYEKIIIVLIVQLCALLTLFVKKDWDMQKALMKFISENEVREDAKRK